MSIWVCSMARAQELARYHKPERIISLLGREEKFPDFEGYDEKRHLRLLMDDVSHDLNDRAIAPEEGHAQAIIDTARQWTGAAPLLIHCQAGVSRSSAAAVITLSTLNPTSDPEDIAFSLRCASMTARPNKRLIEKADRLLKHGGRLIEAVRGIEGSWEFHPEVSVMPYRLNASLEENSR